MLLMNSKRTRTPLAYLLGKNFFKYSLTSTDREINRRSKMFTEYSTDIIHALIKKHRDNKGEKAEGIIDLVIKRNLIILDGQRESP